jgi:hypothetical protein
MPPIELHLAEDGTIYKKNPENALSFKYSRLSDEELRNEKDLLCNNKTRRKSQGGSTGDQATEPTIGIGARTNAENAISGDDYLH